MINDELVSRWAPTLYATSQPLPVAATQEQDEPEPSYSRTGVMVAFFLDPDSAAALAQPGGEPEDELHVTLSFLGFAGKHLRQDQEQDLITCVRAWATTTAPIVQAAVSGVGFFFPGVTYASVDGPDLPQLRESLVAALADKGFTTIAEHGFTPHITLEYAERRDLTVQPRDLNFSQVVVAFAGRRTHIDLGAESSATFTHTGSPSTLGYASIVTHERPTGPDLTEAVAEETAKAFVTDLNGHTIISAPASTIASLREPTVDDIANDHLLWMHGRFVGADVPNRNGALWSAGDLEMSAASVTHGPLNWLHESRHVIGTLAEAAYVNNVNAVAADGDIVQPHITATAAIWKWIWPDEAFVVQQASDLNQLWYSMECISKEVTCAGEAGCGNTTTYANYMSGAACEHVNQRASVRQFVNPIFLGGAVIVPPTRPGWAEADASVMKTASRLAEAAFEQAGEPDIASSQWEQMMAQLVRFTQK